jgi:ribosomal protein S18 acetylase RimI-like enzyme
MFDIFAKKKKLLFCALCNFLTFPLYATDTLKDEVETYYSSPVTQEESGITIAGLKQYGEQNVGPVSKKFFAAIYNDGKGEPVTLCGAIEQQTLFLLINPLREIFEKSPDVLRTFLRDLPSKIDSHIVCAFFSSPDAMLLKAEGFVEGPKISLEDEPYDKRPYAYYKTPSSPPIKGDDRITLVWPEMKEESSTQPYPQSGVFLRRNEKIVGGIIACSYGTEAFIQKFWVLGDLRGKGYGSTMLKLLESKLREQGVKTITLETASYQAPKFYEKEKYEKIGELPETKKRLTGEWSNDYVYRKDFKES